MKYKCETCHDTGDKDKDSGELGYLNCPDCDAPMQRAALNKWLSSMRNLGKDDLAWAIYQRALAMAPKQEAPGQKSVGMVAKSSFASHKVLVATTQLDDVPLGAKLYLAAPAVANGALTDAMPMSESLIKCLAYGHGIGSEIALPFARAILAAAGPDAALADLLSEVSDVLAAQNWRGDLQERLRDVAALSGAKGN